MVAQTAAHRSCKILRTSPVLAPVSGREKPLALTTCSNADGMIPHLIAVEKNQANGSPPSGRQSIPYIAAGGTAAAIQSYLPINGVARGACSVAAPWLNTVQRVVRIGNTAVPGKVPAQIFDVRCPGGACTVGLVGAGDLAVQNRGVVAVICIIKQHDAVLRACQSHYTVFIFRIIG